MGMFKKLLEAAAGNDQAADIVADDIDDRSAFASAEAAIDRAVAALKSAHPATSPGKVGVDRRAAAFPDRREMLDGPLPDAGDRRSGPRDRRHVSTAFGKRRLQG
ncbi:MAG: hypothetical protein NW216_11770 [Hyphomicrobium sp.]|nr:hypothetical protein [Hyphomicrobium sp.]